VAGLNVTQPDPGIDNRRDAKIGSSVTAAEMQNIYLSRIVRLGATASAFQVAALIVIVSRRRSA
jgi:hypothetical protein